MENNSQNSTSDTKKPIRIKVHSIAETFPLKNTLPYNISFGKLNSPIDEVEKIKKYNPHRREVIRQIKSDKGQVVFRYNKSFDKKHSTESPAENKEKSHGTFTGVFVCCLINIFGVLMFVRTGFMVAQAGLLISLSIIFLSTLTVLITTFSMSAICSNGEIRSGGAYYMISRSLGPSIGLAVGAILCVGCSVAVSFHIVGFADSLLTQTGNLITTSKIHDIRVLGVLICLLLFALVIIGVSWILKILTVLLACLFVALGSFFIGAFYKRDIPFGVIGFSLANLRENLYPNFSKFEGTMQSITTVFAVFFPAVTGIMAGANISGNLKNPSRSIPRGTISAVLLASFVYCIIVIFLSGVVERGEVGGSTGLRNDMLVMVRISAWGPLIYMGIYCASISSALIAFLGAPQILISVAKDSIVPFVSIFDKDLLKRKIPAISVSLLIALCFVSIGNLNKVASLITVFFMATYALINFSCFIMSLNHSPGWRPQFGFYNKYVALSGSIICLFIMFFIDFTVSLLCIFICLVIYIWVDYRGRAVNWGSGSSGLQLRRAIKCLLRLGHCEIHIKNFRPHYLAMIGDTDKRMHLINFLHTLRKGQGAFFLAKIESGRFSLPYTAPPRNSMSQEGYQILQQHCFDNNGYFKTDCMFDKSKIVMFYYRLVSAKFTEGFYHLLQLVGIGRLKPNTVVLGFRENWKQNFSKTEDYFEIIRSTVQINLGLMICRNVDKINFEHQTSDPYGTIDVWWLFDDGGLTLMVPFILSKSKFWKTQTEGGKNVAIRLFIVTEGDPEAERVEFEDLIKKFRLKMQLRMIKFDRNENVDPEVLRQYTQQYPNLSIGPNSSNLNWIRLAQIMKKNSKTTRMSFVTITAPQEDMTAEQYMMWLDIMSRHSDPCILIRGNGDSLLTWYSE